MSSARTQSFVESEGSIAAEKDVERGQRSLRSRAWCAEAPSDVPDGPGIRSVVDADRAAGVEIEDVVPGDRQVVPPVPSTGSELTGCCLERAARGCS